MNLQEETREQVEKLQSETSESETEETKTEEKVDTTSEETQEESDSEEKVETNEVPLSFQKRIDELTWKYKSEHEARVKLEQEMKAARQNPAQPTSEESQKENAAREYLRTLLREEIAATKSDEEKADKALQEECDHVATIYSDFNKTEVLKVMDELGISDVEKGYTAWKKMNRVAEEAKEKTKKDIISKPKSPSSVKTQDGFNTKFDDKTLAEKSIWELAEMAKREAGY